MARTCECCHKGPRFGHVISHAHNVHQKVWLPNLQRVRICTRCLRSGRVRKAVS